MDESLGRRIQRRDRAAFDEMVRAHYADLFDFTRSILRQPDLAEDNLQDVLLNIWLRHS